MGTTVDFKSYFSGHNNCYYNNSMRDLNEDSSSSSWPTCYGEDNIVPYGTYYNGLIPRAAADGKEAIKQTILEHEAIFKNQVYELHRLYGIQRDMMEEYKRKEPFRVRASMEPSSNHRSQIQTQDPRKWHMAGFTLTNSPMNCTKGYNIAQASKQSEPSDSRPLKARKRLFGIQLPADEYVDTDESGKKSYHGTVLADLNEPVEMEEPMAPPSTVDFLDHNPINGLKKVEDHYMSSVKSSLNERGWLSHLQEAGSSRINLGSVTHNLHREKMAILSHPAQGPLNRGPGPGPRSLFDSSGFASRPLSITPWANPTSSHNQKLECLVNGNSNLNSIYGGGISARNGFYQVSASKSDQVLWNNPKPAIDINLNEVEELPPTLPWLIQKSSNGPAIADLNQDMAQPSEKIDINLECQPSEEEIIPPEKEVKSQTKAPFLDLNLCVSDFEEENEDVQLLQGKEKEMADAAEAMVSMSSATLAESLMGFVDGISDELERDGMEMDEFEAMTLEIEETKEEEYMARTFVSEETRVVTSGVLVTRQRKRGRQRRDFQRDILPGLVSLSRHEVSEDIQTFGGMMRASGQGRRRRRGVEESDRSCQAPVAGGGVEDRSLTGWGKRTRRPRRQRCPAVVGV